ncbi:MAG: chemotaxis response regulator protein-glutamate methylesterase [Desulfobacterales bacterium]|nr:chemotaxis response regulator protein-glutamate methylesterase [Desulfobacterales bacterium]
MNDLRVLVVDDTIMFRKIVSDVLSEIPGVKVVGTANNGKIALGKINNLNPNLITLDIEMPEMNGIEVLEIIQKQYPDIGVIMLSSLTYEGGEMTIKALELGAFDFITKPQSGNLTENKLTIKNNLIPILNAFKRRLEIKTILKGRVASAIQKKEVKETPKIIIPSRDILKEPIYSDDAVHRLNRFSSKIKQKPDIIAIGISTGGPSALAHMMPNIPSDIGIPILIVQHMPPIFTQSLARSLSSKCSISVKEASEGDILLPNIAFIAPGGKQMKLSKSYDGRNIVVRITDDPPENSCKPSVDFLFRSIADFFPGKVTAVIMTGMGSDGTNGLKILKSNGAFIIAQNEETCTVFGMPKVPIELGIVDVIAPLDQIATEIVKTVKRCC